jgi:hypothetical protein
MRSLLALVLLAPSACGDVHVLDEQEGITAARAAFTRHDIGTGSTRPFGPLMIDEVAVDFTVDGWSLADNLGFEYVSEADPDFTEAATDLGALDQQPRLQAAVDEALMVDEPGVHILILRTWSHETATLARDQLDRHVDAWLTSLGR